MQFIFCVSFVHFLVIVCHLETCHSLFTYSIFFHFTSDLYGPVVYKSYTFFPGSLYAQH